MRRTRPELVDVQPQTGGLVPEGNDLERLLIEVAQRGASDLLLVAGAPPMFRVGGLLTRSESAPLAGEEILHLLTPSIPGRWTERLNQEGALDFSLRLAARCFGR